MNSVELGFVSHKIGFAVQIIEMNAVYHRRICFYTNTKRVYNKRSLSYFKKGFPFSLCEISRGLRFQWKVFMLMQTTKNCHSVCQSSFCSRCISLLYRFCFFFSRCACHNSNYYECQFRYDNMLLRLIKRFSGLYNKLFIHFNIDCYIHVFFVRSSCKDMTVVYLTTHFLCYSFDGVHIAIDGIWA